jgi:hypothetical protein
MFENQKKRGKRNWRPFEEAREYVRGLGLRNLSEWLAWAKSEARPGFIPANPNVILVYGTDTNGSITVTVTMDGYTISNSTGLFYRR